MPSGQNPQLAITGHHFDLDLKLFGLANQFIPAFVYFVRRADGWYHGSSGARLEPEGFAAAGGTPTSASRIDGFDTFWYMWSLTNPATEILKPLASSQ